MKAFKLALPLALASLICANAFADPASSNSSTSMQLLGTVATACTISVTPTAKSTTLNITGGESSTLVGVVTENCNDGVGYTVTVTSSNLGQLVSTATGSTPTTYTATYDNATGAINKALTATRTQAYFAKQGNLAVTFAGNSQAIAGSYSDNLNIVIAAK